MVFIITLAVGAESKDSSPKTDEGNNLSSEEVNNLEEYGFSENAIDDLEFAGYSYDEIKGLEFQGNDDKYYKFTEKLSDDYNSENNTVGKDNVEDYEIEEIPYDEFSKGVKELKEEAKSGKDEYNIGINKSDETKTGYKRMSLTLTKKTNGNYKVSNNVTWFNTPSNRKKDIIGIGSNANTSPVPGTEYGKQKWSTLRGDESGQAIYTKNSGKWNRKNDYGLYFKLKNNRKLKAPWTTIRMYMEYDITPNVDNVRKVDAWGHYAHQKKAKNITPTFDIKSGTLSITVSNKKKFTQHRPNPHVQIDK